MYSKEMGWSITEMGKSKPSTNGTSVFMKTASQIDEHHPSDMIPLHDGMVIIFGKYELKVQFVNKDTR
jgi:hypothetical protein